MRTYLDALGSTVSLLDVPTLLLINCSDTTMHATLLAGILVSLGLTLNLAPRYCLIAAWGLYLSFASVGQAFLSFQWDNLLLETAFFALFITPPGLRPRGAPAPPPIGVFLMQWLLFRLYVESGAAKWLRHDPTWRGLTAMVAYYESPEAHPPASLLPDLARVLVPPVRTATASCTVRFVKTCFQNCARG